MSFADRLAEAVERTGSVLALAIDPRVDALPAPLSERVRLWGEDPRIEGALDPVSAVGQVTLALVRAAAGRIPAVKLNVGFFEALGAGGISVLEGAITYARHLGLLVIADGKRADVPSSSAMVARAYLADDVSGLRVGLSSDALTVNPYLGSDALGPMLSRAGEGRGVFVVVRTSNAGAGEVQDLPVDGHPLWEHVARRVAVWGEPYIGRSGWSSVGAVVGATRPREFERARALLGRAWLLVPGIGAQGGRIEDLAPLFDARGLGALVTVGRAVMDACVAASSSSRRWGDAAVAAIEEISRGIESVRPGGRPLGLVGGSAL